MQEGERLRYIATVATALMVMLMAFTTVLTAPVDSDEAPEPEGQTPVSGKGGSLPAGDMPGEFDLSSTSGYFTPNMGQWADSSLLFSLTGVSILTVLSGVWRT